jgi:hypothetical protein
VGADICNLQPAFSSHERYTVSAHLERLITQTHSEVARYDTGRYLNCHRCAAAACNGESSGASEKSSDEDDIGKKVSTVRRTKRVACTGDTLGCRPIPVHQLIFCDGG